MLLFGPVFLKKDSLGFIMACHIGGGAVRDKSGDFGP